MENKPVYFKNMTSEEKSAYHREYYKRNKKKRQKQMLSYYHKNPKKHDEFDRRKELSQEIEWLFVGNKSHKFLCKLMKIKP